MLTLEVICEVDILPWKLEDNLDSYSVTVPNSG